MRIRRADPEVTKLRRSIVRAWNKGGKSYAEIATAFCVSPDRVRLALDRARRLGWKVRRHDPSNSATTALRKRVVKAFNKGATQAEIGLAFGLSRGVVGRLLAEARAKGIQVRRYTHSEIAARAQASYRARIGEDAYRAWLAPKIEAANAAWRQRLAAQSIEPAGIPRD